MYSLYDTSYIHGPDDEFGKMNEQSQCDQQ